MNTGFTVFEHLRIPEKVRPDIVFEKRYIELRQKEYRFYSDEQLMLLPAIDKNHPHHIEWQIRKRSSNRLLHHLEKRQPLKILEVGCGNGWLSHRLATLPGSKITGTDINFTELQQAARVFSHIPNLQFMYCDIRSGVLMGIEFDCIIFAASIQYFGSIPEIMHCAMQQLKANGEIHILDSPFYKPSELPAAKQRTKNYYQEIGFPEMAEHYFHHSVTDLTGFEYEMLYQPSPLQHYLLKNKNPFPWLLIKKKIPVV